jgi:hypothetical protein
MTPKDWLTKRKNKQVNTNTRTRFAQAFKRAAGDPTTKSRTAARMASAGRSVKANLKKDSPTVIEENKYESHTNPRIMGASESQRAGMSQDEQSAQTRVLNEKQAVPVKTPTKSGFNKFVSKAKGGIAKRMGRRRYNVL